MGLCDNEIPIIPMIVRIVFDSADARSGIRITPGGNLPAVNVDRLHLRRGPKTSADTRTVSADCGNHTAVNIHGSAAIRLEPSDSGRGGDAGHIISVRCSGIKTARTVSRALGINTERVVVVHGDTAFGDHGFAIHQDQMRFVADEDTFVNRHILIDYIPLAVFKGFGAAGNIFVTHAGILAGLLHQFLLVFIPGKVGNRFVS